jgi:hypothetical protein
MSDLLGGFPDITPEDMARMTDGRFSDEYLDPVEVYKANLRAKVVALRDMDLRNLNRDYRLGREAGINAVLAMMDRNDG